MLFVCRLSAGDKKRDLRYYGQKVGVEENSAFWRLRLTRRKLKDRKICVLIAGSKGTGVQAKWNPSSAAESIIQIVAENMKVNQAFLCICQEM